MSNLGKYSRRGLLAVGGLVGGGLVLGIGGAFLSPDRLSRKGGDSYAGRLSTWITITPDDTITILVPHAEMGQGVHNALAMMAADEMDANWDHVRVAEAPALDDFANGYIVQAVALGRQVPAMLRHAVNVATFTIAQLGVVQITGGSFSVRSTGDIGMRTAGATARRMLLTAAAQKFGVPVETLTVKSGIISDPASGKTLRFGEIATAAASLPIPAEPVLKQRADFTIMGREIPRADIPPKVNGAARYGIDTVWPGMLYASIVASPVFGAKLVSVDAKPATAMAGVVRVVPLENAVAVVADSWWRAQQAVQALSPVFETIPASEVTSATLAKRIADTLAQDGKTDHHQGDGASALGTAVHVIDATYTAPFLAHATMEPPNATAVVANGQVEIWSGVQDPLAARKVAADAAGVSVANVTLHNALLGGGFGRRLPGAFDYVDQAVRIAAVMSPTPIKLIWPREEDIQHDFYRTTAAARFKGGLDAAGAPTVWTSTYVGTGDDDAAHLLYDIPHQAIDHATIDHHVRLGFWRSVDHSFHGFFTESFIDELAHAAGIDPFAFRRDRLTGRARAVLELAANKANWGSKLPEGQGRGIALVKSFGTLVAEIAEVTVATDGTVKINRVVAAVDCGDVVNPNAARAQVEGAIMFGLSAAMWGDITIDKGAVVQSSFPDYRVAQLADTPAIEVHFIDAGGPRGGLGEQIGRAHV